MGKSLFNEEEKQYILSIYKGKWVQEITDLFNERFNRNLTQIQIQNWLSNRYLKTGVIEKYYSDEETKFLKRIIKNNYTNDVIDEFEKKFKRKLSVNQVYAFRRKYGLTNGMDTTFKSGHKSHNAKEVGSERTIYERGVPISYVKVSKSKWVRKQIYLYKKYKGPIPKGHKIIFLDGNHLNFDLDNLEAVSNDELVYVAGSKLLTNNRELNKTALAVAKLSVKTKEMEEKYEII